MARIEAQIDEIESRRKQLPVTELSFNSFYEFSVQRIPDICQENQIQGIDISTYRTSVRKTRFMASTSVPIAI